MERRLRLALGFWLAVAGVVWNGFFDILVTRGEKQYLLVQARHELGAGPPASMDDVMSVTIHDAARTATVWALLVFAAGAGCTVYVRRVTTPSRR
jgi:hypothetical protein